MIDIKKTVINLLSNLLEKNMKLEIDSDIIFITELDAIHIKVKADCYLYYRDKGYMVDLETYAGRYKRLDSKDIFRIWINLI